MHTKHSEFLSIVKDIACGVHRVCGEDETEVVPCLFPVHTRTLCLPSPAFPKGFVHFPGAQTRNFVGSGLALFYVGYCSGSYVGVRVGREVPHIRAQGFPNNKNPRHTHLQ